MLSSAEKLARQPRESKSKCRKRALDGLAELKANKPPVSPPESRRFKFGCQTLEGILASDPRRVWLTVGNSPHDFSHQSALAILELPDGFLLKAYMPEEEVENFMTYRAGDPIALSGLISKTNIMHVIEIVPMREGR